MRDWVERDELYAVADGKQAKRLAKTRAQSRPRSFSRRAAKKNYLWRIVHRKCTEHPQLFNSAPLDASIGAHYA
jgi:hypothetical protein